MSAPPAPPAPPAPNPHSPHRRRGLAVVAGGVTAAALAWGGWHWLHARHFESTDNAYVAGHVVQITPQVGGTVIAVGADETDAVRRGQWLVELDPADTRLALEQAEAQLAQAVREVRALFANGQALDAQSTLRQAEVERARAEVARLQADLDRRRPLLASGAIGQEELQHTQAQWNAARSALHAAESGLVVARKQWSALHSQIDGTDIAHHPLVEGAAARVREAYLAAGRTRLLSPVDGQVAKRQVQLGQRVQAGAPLMTVVSGDALWVDANFKESQLQRLRIGQSVQLVADVYGDRVTYHGRVAGLGAGTGSAFALLPAQNATGNWIKVVQRVPVRIQLDPAELATHPLRIGLSMTATVDTRTDSAPPAMPDERPVATQAPTDHRLLEAHARVQSLIQQHLGPHAAQPHRD